MSNFTAFVSALAVAALLGFSPPTVAQEAARTVTGNAGDYYTNLQFGDLHWTVGEVAVSRFQSGISLAEGFHRMYFELVVETQEVQPEDWQVRLFPNPTAAYLQAEWPSGQPVSAQLLSATGQPLKQINELYPGAPIDLTRLPAGTYFLQLEGGAHQRGTFRVLKINR